jgi:hypothetical protein
VQSCSGKNLFYVGALGVRGPDGILAIRERDVSIQAQIHDHFRLAGKAVNMPRRMIVGVHDEANAIELERTRANNNPSALRLLDSFLSEGDV